MESIAQAPHLNPDAAFALGRPVRMAVWIVVAGAMLHLALASLIDLSPDEAHYALFGAHPDWSYFDHPGLTGWLQAPFVALGGSNVAMRVVPMVSWVLAALLTATLVRRLPLSPASAPGARRWDVAWAVALLATSPLLYLLGVSLVPDTLLMPLVPAAMLLTWQLRDPATGERARPWLALGGVLGLCLLAKYTGLFVALGAVASLHVFHGAAFWRRRGPWLTLITTLAIATPIIGWNAAHDWISIFYQADHAAGRGEPWRVAPLLRAVVLQLLLFGIPAWVGGWRGARVSLQGDVDVRDARRLCAWFALPVMAAFGVAAGHGASLPHWTTCGWMAVLPLAVAGLRRLRGWTLAAMFGWQILLLALVVFVLARGGLQEERGSARVTPAGVRLPGTVPNPVADLRGWPDAAAHAASLAVRYHARGAAVMNWSLASRIAWYARPLPVFVAPPRVDQFALWFGTLERGDAFVVVDWSGLPLAAPQSSAGFQSCQAIDQMPVVVEGRQIAHFNFLLCRGWADPPGVDF